MRGIIAICLYIVGGYGYLLWVLPHVFNDSDMQKKINDIKQSLATLPENTAKRILCAIFFVCFFAVGIIWPVSFIRDNVMIIRDRIKQKRK